MPLLTRGSAAQPRQPELLRPELLSSGLLSSELVSCELHWRPCLDQQGLVQRGSPGPALSEPGFARWGPSGPDCPEAAPCTLLLTLLGLPAACTAQPCINIALLWVQSTARAASLHQFAARGLACSESAAA